MAKVDIDLTFAEATADDKWPDRKFTRSVVQALDTMTRYAHIQPYRLGESSGDIEHATFRKVFDPFLVFPFSVTKDGKTRAWSSIDDDITDNRVDRGNSDFTALESLKYRLRDYPEAVEALEVLQQVAQREKDWKNSVRASTTPEQCHEMFAQVYEKLHERDCVSVPHSEVDDSPAAQVARLRVIGAKKFGGGTGSAPTTPQVP